MKREIISETMHYIVYRVGPTRCVVVAKYPLTSRGKR